MTLEAGPGCPHRTRGHRALSRDRVGVVSDSPGARPPGQRPRPAGPRSGFRRRASCQGPGARCTALRLTRYARITACSPVRTRTRGGIGAQYGNLKALAAAGAGRGQRAPPARAGHGGVAAVLAKATLSGGLTVPTPGLPLPVLPALPKVTHWYHRARTARGGAFGASGPSSSVDRALRLRWTGPSRALVEYLHSPQCRKADRSTGAQGDHQPEGAS